MGTGGARRGRRDNGLVAAEYAVAGDVDPRVGEHLLDVLGASSIAAYLQPAADLHPVTRTTTMPARPTDRLYVDRVHLETARGYLAELAEGGARAVAPPAAAPSATAPPPTTTPAPSGAVDAEAVPDGKAVPDAEAVPDAAAVPDVEAQWARIVAAFRAEAEAESRRWPDATGMEAAAHDAPRRAARGPDEPSLLDGLDTFGAGLPDEDEGSYTPPPPPPLPRPSPVVVLAVMGIVVGFILFLRPDLAPFDAGLTQLVSFVAVLAGVVALILRLRPGDDDEDGDPDDGAVV